MPTLGNPIFFPNAAAFRRWLERHHASATELWVGFYKKASGRPSLTYAESVDEALCFGWIDGVRKSIDAESYVNRFTPRRPGSVWSDINTRRANKAAWAFFQSQPPGYRRVLTWWIVSAKQVETRARLGLLIEDSAAGRRIGPMPRPGSKRS